MASLLPLRGTAYGHAIQEVTAALLPRNGDDLDAVMLALDPTLAIASLLHVDPTTGATSSVRLVCACALLTDWCQEQQQQQQQQQQMVGRSFAVIPAMFA